MTDLKDSYDHLIIGGGIAADAAARAIREADEHASIAILSADPHAPVYRPALSKDLWTGEDPDPDSQDLGTAAATGAELFTSTLVTELLPASHTAVTARGQRVHYRKALLATGEAPEPPVNPMSADRVRWEHIQRVYELCDHNVSETARRLGMHRRTLQRILAKRAPR